VKTIEIQAKTIDVAIEEALEKLNCGHEDVEIEIISSGGMFKKAKIKATLKASAIVKEGPEPVIVKEEKKAEESFEALLLEKDKERAAQPPRRENTRRDSAPKVVIEKPEIIPVADSEMPDKLRASKVFVEKFLQLIESDATVIASVDDKALKLDISGDDVGRLIGKGGVALAALQTIVTSVAIGAGEGEKRRVYVNIENYKEKREVTLRELGLKKAEVVKRTGKTLRLDPMIPRERAIIHTALQEVEGIKTFSKGTDPNRYLVIAPVEKGEGKKREEKRAMEEEKNED